MVRFHVVNSVKGGCGKSTFSLYLANFLTEKNHKVVIIDLDIGGSTWYRGFKSYLVNTTAKSTENKDDIENEEIKFLNDLLYEYDKNQFREHVFKVSVDCRESKESSIINVIMTNPKEAACIHDEKLDLLEEAICSLVDEIATNSYPQNPEDKIDIIFDMPPGYEEHSERILMHALMDLGSSLYNKYTSVKKNGEYQNPVYLYMISGVKQAALKANIQYVERFYKKPSYSMDTGVLNNQNTFFVFNDVDASYKEYVKTVIGAASLIKAGKTLTENISGTEKINGGSVQVSIIHHLPIKLTNQGYKNIITSKEDAVSTSYPLIDDEGGFKDLFETMKHLSD